MSRDDTVNDYQFGIIKLPGFVRAALEAAAESGLGQDGDSYDRRAEGVIAAVLCEWAEGRDVSVSKAPGSTPGELEAGLRNLGHDPTCGACMAIFWTGVAPGIEHTCPGADPNLHVKVTMGGAGELEAECEAWAAESVREAQERSARAHAGVIDWLDPADPPPMDGSALVLTWREVRGLGHETFIPTPRGPAWFMDTAYPDSPVTGWFPYPQPPKARVHTGAEPKRASLASLAEKVARGRAKFPGRRFMLAALMEEAGELARALLQRKGQDEVRAEALDVAVVALRIYEEGDATFDDITEDEALP